jgi:poly(A) polymerase
MNGLPGLEDGRLRERKWLERGPAARVLAALNGSGEETRVVGGAVRDLALGLPVGEVDLATTATPDEVIRRARRSGFQAIPTGLAHGTVTLIVARRSFETTTLREDVETDGRHAKVAFGRDFDADARRRDLTINALSLDREGFVHDPVGGLADLAAGQVRFIGAADLRIREDYLRILRFFRFSARFGGGVLDAEGFCAAVRNRDGLDRLSRERVHAEIFKLVAAPRAGAVVTAMAESGLLQGIFAGMAWPGRFARFVAANGARADDEDAMLRLMALSVAIVEDADRLRERLKLANAEHRRAVQAARALESLHGLESPPSPQCLDALSVTFGRGAVRDALRLAEAEAGFPSEAAFAESCRHLSQTPQPTVPFSGRDVIARGVAPGPRVGRALAAFQAAWLAAGLPRDPHRLDALLGQAIAAAERAD